MPIPSPTPIAIRFVTADPLLLLADVEDVFVLCVVAIPEIEVDDKVTKLVIELGSVADGVVVPVVAASDADKNLLAMLLLLQILAFITYSDKKNMQRV